MVGPISDDERSSFNRRVTIGVTLLVGLSAGLVALQVDPTPLQAVGAVALGLVVGYPLARFVVPTGPAPATRQRRRRRKRRDRDNPFADGGDDGDESDGGNRSNGDGTGGGSGSRGRGRR
ncbi:hypothetical protein ACFQMA_19225 [Halosimplex aquaticum]|uniref:Uncharacterized protein n=1 Tax=Halosimplex aquaticum TaxID=3026162 RepID=A0ABD5Y8B4_9EURY|nr:hypothetical protein [Halosimplex aquaticum]